jgi:hypothetical protein
MTSPIATDIAWPEFMARHDLVWDRVPSDYFEGAFVGNGLVGAIVFRDDVVDGAVGFEVGRTDVYDHRPDARRPAGEIPADFRGGVNTPYSREWFTAAAHDRVRLPIGRLVLKPLGEVLSARVRVDLWNAELRGRLETSAGAVAFRCFVPGEENAIILELETEGGETGCAVSFRPHAAVSPRYLANPKRDLEVWGRAFDYVPNPPFEVKRVEGDEVVVQPLLAGSDYATAWREVVEGSGRRTIFVAVANLLESRGSEHEALASVRGAAAVGVAAFEAAHRAWWHDYYRASFVSLPDARIESFYWIQLYKMASATREGAPVVDLMGPWFKPTVWAAYWHNLNTQLAYYTVHITNHVGLGENLCRLLEDRVADLVGNVPPEYRHDSAALGYPVGVRDLRAPAPGPVRGEIGEGAYHFIALPWFMHHLYRHWRHTMDDARLRRSFYPLMRRAFQVYLHVLERDAEGRCHIPRAYSDEYDVAEDTSMNIALLRWGLGALLEIDARLGLRDPGAARWREVLENLVDYPVDPEKGIMVGAGMPFDKPHRHYSHLFGLFPLGLEAAPEDPARRALLVRSVARHVGLDGDNCMYKFTGSSSMYAALGMGEEALAGLERALRILPASEDSTVTPNTFYSEFGGWQTFESPISAARSVLDMLMQSGASGIRVFPACPAAWGDVVFHQLRAEGAFLVSAERRGGVTRWVGITSLAGEPCRVCVEGVWHELDLAAGESRVIGGDEAVVRPVEASGPTNAWGGAGR